ncbi:Hypothetical protein Bdt_1226 [Bdellovibrio bacteriovorus str. Tiberius]|uniref:Uncharacterized protein n=1 Tax=Bdellovibrio bacteriovorus str. Tiberius TaxID=1069642 RepID=K7YW60_BDEBC|nr:Hypothetical protein Bdt_1226 [Bdellovibrio bacteriovorus str. Tiberius]
MPKFLPVSDPKTGFHNLLVASDGLCYIDSG